MVTGASSGIGAAVARALGHVGAMAVACVHDSGALQSIINNIERDGGSANAVCANVYDELDTECLTETVACTGRCIDVLATSTVAVHGTSGEMPVLEDSYMAFDDALRANVCSVFATVKEALLHVVDDGRILIPSGSTAREAKPGMSTYAISEVAAEALVRQSAADHDQTVTVADSGLVATDLTGGQGRGPDDVIGPFIWMTADVDPAEFNDSVANLKAWERVTR